MNGGGSDAGVEGEDGCWGEVKAKQQREYLRPEPRSGFARVLLLKKWETSPLPTE